MQTISQTECVLTCLALGLVIFSTGGREGLNLSPLIQILRGKRLGGYSSVLGGLETVVEAIAAHVPT